ncbi:MAG: RAD55 family ATPase [Archaeoglobaceae archaeon]
MRQFTTGISSLDTQLGGGLSSGSVVLLLEEPGAGADIFSLHVAIEGLKNNEKVLYVTTDDTVEELKESISLYFDVSTDILSQIDIIDLVSTRMGLPTEEDSAKAYLKRTRYDTLSGLKTSIQDERYDRVIINNITYFFTHYDREEVFKLIEDFSATTKQDESLFFMLMTKGMFDHQTEVAMKHSGDGVIEFTMREIEDEMQRRLKVLKLKRALVPKTVLRYDLTNKGFRMESVMRVL